MRLTHAVSDRLEISYELEADVDAVVHTREGDELTLTVVRRSAIDPVTGEEVQLP